MAVYTSIINTAKREPRSTGHRVVHQTLLVAHFRRIRLAIDNYANDNAKLTPRYTASRVEVQTLLVTLLRGIRGGDMMNCYGRSFL